VLLLVQRETDRPAQLRACGTSSVTLGVAGPCVDRTSLAVEFDHPVAGAVGDEEHAILGDGQSSNWKVGRELAGGNVRMTYRQDQVDEAVDVEPPDFQALVTAGE